MSSPRPLAFALGLAGALAGISVYLASTAAVGEGEVAAAAAERVESDRASDYASPNAVAGGDYEVQVVTERRGDVVFSAPASWAVTVRVGRALRTASAEFVAGSGMLGGSPAGRQLVRLRFDDAETSVMRVVDGDRGLPERLEMTPDAEVRGRVTDADGRGIEGVVVGVGDCDEGGALEVVSDVEGRYVLRSEFGGPGVPVVYRAPGFAPTFRIVDLGVRFTTLDVGLEPSRTLEVQVAARVDRPELGAVQIVPDSHDDVLVHHPFFARDAVPLDASGAATLRDLPTRGIVRVVVAHPDLVEPRVRSVDLASHAGLPVVLQAAGPGRFGVGAVVDTAGAPIADAEVTVESRVRGAISSRPMLRPSAYRVGVGSTRTDAGGRYRIARPDRGCSLTVRAPGRAGVRLQVAARAEWPSRVVLPELPRDEVRPTLRLRFPALGRTGRLRTDGGAWGIWSDATPTDVELDAPGLLDVTVLVMRDGRTVLERRFESLVVAGAAELQLH